MTKQVAGKSAAPPTLHSQGGSPTAPLSKVARFVQGFTTHQLEASYDMRTVQELLGHEDVATTMIYTHVMKKPGIGVKSPLDRL